MNTPGTYRLFLIKDIKRRAVPEPGSTCFRHFNNMCCRCVQRGFGGRRQHSCCLRDQFTSKRNNLPSVDGVSSSWYPFSNVCWYKCAMVKNSSMLREPLLANKPINSVFIDACYDDTNGDGTDNIVAATASEVSVIRMEEKHFQEEGEICISHSSCCIDRYCPLSTDVWSDKAKPMARRGNGVIYHVVGNTRGFQVGYECFSSCLFSSRLLLHYTITDIEYAVHYIQYIILKSNKMELDDEKVRAMDRIEVRRLSPRVILSKLDCISLSSCADTVSASRMVRIHACAHCCGLDAFPVTNLQTTLPRWSRNLLIWRRNPTGRLLMSCPLTRVLWRQIALNCRGCLSSGCHQLFIGLSLSTRTLNRLSTGLVVVVPRTHTRAHTQTHARTHNAFNAHVCTQKHSDKHTLLNGYLHSFSHSLCSHPPTPENPSNENKMFLFSQDRG